ncbi:MAG: PEP-CTERM sorting domain-containing protein [Cyanobacteriota bacterium]|nr:PEP-CTERM sorting domain-containing protein [Cyanobacteriota bacterium]
MRSQTSIATLGAAVLTLGTVAVGAAPVQAGTITFDTSAQVSGNVSVNEDFASYANGLLGSSVIPGGDFSFNESLNSAFTIDDDPQQYLDGDISLGIDLFYSALGLNLDTGTITLLDSLFNVAVSGSGTLSNGTESLGFSLSYDSTQQEIIATFANFDPQNNFIDSCLTGSCTTAGNFDFGLLAEAPLSFLVGAEPVSASGSFSVTTTPQTTNEPSLPPTDGEPNQSVPEPTTFLGLLGTAGFLATRRKRSAVK